MMEGRFFCCATRGHALAVFHLLTQPALAPARLRSEEKPSSAPAQLINFINHHQFYLKTICKNFCDCYNANVFIVDYAKKIFIGYFAKFGKKVF